MQTVFKRQIFEKYAKNLHIAKSMITFLLTNHISEWHQVIKRKNLDFIFIRSEVATQTRWSVTILLWSIAWLQLTRREKCDFWCQELSDGIHLSYFASIISTAMEQYQNIKSFALKKIQSGPITENKS